MTFVTTDTAPTGEPKKTSRAGRNLPAAISVGVVLGGTVIATLLWAPQLWVALVALAVALATHEVVRRLREGGYAVPVIPLLIGGQAMIWLTWPYREAGALGAFGATVALYMIWRLLSGGLKAAPVHYTRDVSVTIFLAAWVPLFGAFTALLIYPNQGGYHEGAMQVFCMMLGVVASDIGGYTAGVLFGKHPMVPAISPKKSWEGFSGSLLFSIIVSVLSVHILADRPLWVGVPLGIMLVITGTLGDLVESQVKRDLGIKDMGTLLPGHGGLMDRIDSILPSAVAAWLVLEVLA